MSAAADRLNYLAVDHNVRILVPIPSPGVRGTDLVHYVFFQHLRQRFAPNIQSGQSKSVDADVVVFVGGTRRSANTVKPLVRVAVRPIGPVGLSPKRPFPIAGLAKQVFPCDLAVMLGPE